MLRSKTNLTTILFDDNGSVKAPFKTKIMTAVEWLESEYEKLLNWHIPMELLEQAKDMEKQQILKTARYFFHELGDLTPIQYYEQTFKNKNK